MLCCGMGMGCKEVMVAAPLLVLWYDRVFVAGSWRDILRRRWGFYAALAATWPILIMAVASQAYRYGEFFEEEGRSPWEYAINQPSVILHYLRLTFFPAAGQCLFYLWHDAASLTETVAPSIALAAIVAAAGWCVVRRPPLGFVAGVSF